MLSLPFNAQTPQPSATQSQPTPTPSAGGEKPADNTAANMTAVAAMITAVLGGIAAVITAWQLSKKSEAKLTLDQQNFEENFTKEMQENTELFERCMRNVFTDEKHSGSLWLEIFQRLGADEKARQKVVEALLLGISYNPELRARLRALIVMEENRVETIAEEGYESLSQVKLETLSQFIKKSVSDIMRKEEPAGSPKKEPP